MSKSEAIHNFWELILAGGVIGTFLKFIFFVPPSSFSFGASLTLISAVLHRIDPRAGGRQEMATKAKGLALKLRGNMWLMLGGMGFIIMLASLSMGYVGWSQASPLERDAGLRDWASKWAAPTKLR